MRIAFISHEFPPETGGGGIGTYLDQVTGALIAAGDSVEVFAGANENSTSTRADGVVVHRLACESGAGFGTAIVDTFAAVHAHRPFDVMEGSDFEASALGVKRRFPHLPYVCKLHTPRVAIEELHYKRPTGAARLRMSLGALRRGNAPPHFNAHSLWQTASAQLELAAIAEAEMIAAPSEAIAVAAERWVPGCTTRLRVFPYPYLPKREILAIPAVTNTKRVTFIGRLEERKGVLDLSAAIPWVLARQPAARFRFIGRAMPSGPNGTSMDVLLRSNLGSSAKAVEFVGVQTPASIPGWLADTDVLVAPSHWESFGLVCCEGLAAARAVIGSEAGGMAEILDHGRCGLLVPPKHPMALADAILRLLESQDERRRLGELGRQRILDHYSVAVVMPAQSNCYRDAISACRERQAA